VAKDESRSTGETFVGPLTWKHVGLCSVNGPEERVGEIQLQIHRSWLAAKIEAKLTFGDDQCVYSGAFAEGTTGLMTCGNGAAVPLRLDLK
jgi:hypothetical protein